MGGLSNSVGCEAVSPTVLPRLSFTKSGNTMQVRSGWNDTSDFITRMLLEDIYNGCMSFTYMLTVGKAVAHSDVTAGTNWKNATDDITPIYINDSYIGAGHGYYAGYMITSAGHGKTEADIGSEWVAENAIHYIILKVPTVDTILVCSVYTGVDKTPLTLTAPTTPMVHSTGATHTDNIVFGEAATIHQIDPCLNNHTKKVYIDKTDEFDLLTDGTVYGNDVDVVEQYDIVHIPTMLTYIIANVGSNTNESIASDAITEKYCTVTLNYRFGNYGTCVITQSVDFAREVKLGFLGFVQSITVGDKAYVPLTDYSTITTQAELALTFAAAVWTAADNPPNRFFQFNDDLSKGMCLGYCPEYGFGIDANRLIYCDDAGQYYTTKKMYPYLIDGMAATPPNLNINAVCFRVPIQAWDSDFTNVSWYEVEGATYLMVDAHKSLDKYLVLPASLQGKTATLIESDGTISMPNAFVDTNGLKLVVTDYGSAIIRLI